MTETAVEEKAVEEAVNVLGIKPDIEEEEDSEPSRTAQLSEPSPEVEALEQEAAPEAQEEAKEEEAAPEKSSLDIVAERMAPAEQDINERLLQEIQDLRNQQSKYEGLYEGQNRILDKVIAGDEKPELSPVEEFATPAVAQWVADAPDDAERIRRINTISEQLADRKVEARVKPLEERLDKQETDAAQSADVNHREREMALAIQHLRQRGGTAGDLVNEFIAKAQAGQAQDSILMKDWLSIPGVTTSHQHMVKSALGLATMFDEAARSNGTDAPASPGVTEAPQPVSTDTGARPVASKRGQELTQPTPTEDPREMVLGNLRDVRRVGVGNLNDM